MCWREHQEVMEVISNTRGVQSSFYGIKLNVLWNNTMGVKRDLMLEKQKKVLGT